MNKSVKTVLVLTCICAVSAILLAFFNNLTKPAIAKYEQQVVYDSLEDVALGHSFGKKNDYSENSYVTSYYVMSENNKVFGYILNLTSNGYGGPMNIVASYDTDGRILAVKMVSNSETPGVGKKSEKEGYMDKFIGTREDSIPISKKMLSDKDASAVSGATMTFTGISKALRQGSDVAKKLGGVK